MYKTSRIIAKNCNRYHILKQGNHVFSPAYKLNINCSTSHANRNYQLLERNFHSSQTRKTNLSNPTNSSVNNKNGDSDDNHSHSKSNNEPKAVKNTTTFNNTIPKEESKPTYPTQQVQESTYQKWKQSLGDRLENVQGRVEDKLPEKYEHLKQQEGESDSQHRKRLLEGLLHKLKEFVRKYGILGVILYFAIYFGNIGLFYLLLESGLFKKEYAIEKLKSWGMDKHFDLDSLLAGKKSSFAIAWILTKVTEPLRMMLTITIVPYLYRGLVAVKLLKDVSKVVKP